MSDAGGNISLSQLGEVLGIVGPVAAGVWVLFKTVGSIVKAAVEGEAKQRHELAKRTQENQSTLEARTAVLERDGATRKDLDNAEARIKSDISEVKGDVRDMRNATQSILQQVAALGALLGGKRVILGGGE